MSKVIDEVWRPVPGYEGLYAISSIGRLRSLTRYKKIVKPLLTNAGYYQYQLWYKGICHVASAHRLVAQAFIPNPENCPVVNHIDENKLNNCVGNLEWVSHVDNCRYGTAVARRTQHTDYSKRRINYTNQIKACSKPIAQYTKDGVFIRNWKSASECSRETGFSISGIRGVVRGKRNSIFGFVFVERSDDLSHA